MHLAPSHAESRGAPRPAGSGTELPVMTRPRYFPPDFSEGAAQHTTTRSTRTNRRGAQTHRRGALAPCRGRAEGGTQREGRAGRGDAAGVGRALRCTHAPGGGTGAIAAALAFKN